MRIINNPAKWSHNQIRDYVVQNYGELLALECRFCGIRVTLPIGDNIVPEYRHTMNGTNSRADIAVLNAQQDLIAIFEVIDSHSPHPVVLDELKRMSNEVFFLDTQSIVGNQISGWCNPECWEWNQQCNPNRRRNQDPDDYFSGGLPVASSLEFCGRCDTMLTAHTHHFRDWESDPYIAYCFVCAAGQIGAQWATPGSMIRGMEDPDIEKLGWSDDPVAIFHFFTNAEFWSTVWRSRVALMHTGDKPQTGDESATHHRMRVVFTAFTYGHWRVGAFLLRGVGAPAWEQEYHQKLYAWRPENLVQVAAAWQLLANHWYGLLPEEIRRAIAHRVLPERCPVCTQYLLNGKDCYYGCARRVVETHVKYELPPPKPKASTHNGFSESDKMAFEQLNAKLRSRLPGNHG